MFSGNHNFRFLVDFELLPILVEYQIFYLKFETDRKVMKVNNYILKKTKKLI